MGNSKSSTHDSELSQHEYMRPNLNDARSPCPALNTLANHGYLPHDGKNINPQMLSIAMKDRMGLGWLPTKVIVRKAFKTVGKNGLLSLSDLSHHSDDSIEHDGSLSRLDATLSNNAQGLFNQERFNKLLSFSNDGRWLTTEDIAAARLHFKAESQQNNPQCIWNKNVEDAMWTEAAILLHILGRDGKISIEDAKEFFEQERFPERWVRPSSFGVRKLISAKRTLKGAAEQNQCRQKH